MATWVNAAGPITGTTDTANWAGYTCRLIINSAQLTNTGLGLVRVTVEASAGQALTLGSLYIGHAAASGDGYDFEATPTQLLFSGSSSRALAAGQSAVSDETAFTISASKNLIISYYVSGDSTHDDLRYGTATGYNMYYKAAVNEPATIDVTGYTLFLADKCVTAMRVEAAASDGSAFFF